MKAMVTEVMNQGKVIYTAFSCPAGRGVGLWQDSERPEKKTYDVELDFERRIESDMVIRDRLEPGIARVGDETEVCAKIEGVDDDGVAYLRLHESCIVMVDSELTAAMRNGSVVFNLSRDQLRLTPFGV